MYKNVIIAIIDTFIYALCSIYVVTDKFFCYTLMNYRHPSIWYLLMVGSEWRDERLLVFGFCSPSQPSTLTSQHVHISFSNEIYFILFYCKMFHIIHLIRLKFQIAAGAKWSFLVWPVTGLRDMLPSWHNYCLKTSHLLRCRVVWAASWLRSNFRPLQSLILKLKFSVFYTLIGKMCST